MKRNLLCRIFGHKLVYFDKHIGGNYIANVQHCKRCGWEHPYVVLSGSFKIQDGTVENVKIPDGLVKNAFPPDTER